MKDYPNSLKKLQLDHLMLKEINAHLTQNPLDHLFIPKVREILTVHRFRALETYGIRTIDGSHEDVREITVEHNLKNLRKMVGLNRTRRLVGPLLSIDRIFHEAHRMKLLCVGPRTEAELLICLTSGFDLQNISAVDLVSYSPWIDLGDAHALTYDDDQFDLILLGWVLAYSYDIQKMMDEVMRVTKPGGYVAVGCQSLSAAELADPDLHSVGPNRFNEPDDILRLFGDRLDRVEFSSGPMQADRGQRGDVIVVARLK